MLIVDAHLDLAYNAVWRGRDVTAPAETQPVVDNEIATVGVPDLRAARIALACATVFAAPRGRRQRGYVDSEGAHRQAVDQLNWYERQFEAKQLRLVTSRDELPGQSPTSRDYVIPVTLLLEGADAVRSVEDLEMFYERGVRMVGLAWRATRMAGGTGQPGPLTDDGRRTIAAMDRLGMIHDASHLAEQAFWQVLDATDGPIVASHSNCRALVPTDRQLSDDMIKALLKRDAVIGMNFYDQFLVVPEELRSRRCTLADLVRHIQHICDLAGDARHVGLGSDMDGGLGRQEIPVELRTIADLPRVADALSDDGFDDESVAGIMGKNWLRFFRRALR